MKIYPDRLIVARLHRGSAIVQTRRYAYIDTAVPTAIRDMMRIGRAGDLMVLHHDLTGMELGHVKMTAAGFLRTDWVWEREDSPRLRSVK